MSYTRDTSLRDELETLNQKLGCLRVDMAYFLNYPQVLKYISEYVSLITHMGHRH